MLTALILIVLGSLIALAFSWYNRLVRSRNQAREAWSGIDIQLRRRASLVPNLLDAVQGYVQHERGTFEEVTRARSALQRAGGAAEASDANHALTAALGKLFALVESYPQLRASENFRSLQDQLADVEEKIAFARQFYNRNVLDYNNRIEVFPTALIARTFDFRPADFFEADEEGRAEVRAALASSGTAPSRSATPPTT